MSKILVQKVVTVTLEISELEANSLVNLLHSGVNYETLERLGLISIYNNLVNNCEIEERQYKTKAELK